MPKRKIGNQDTIEIVQLHIEGNTDTIIAEKFGVTQQAIHRVLNKPQIKAIKEQMLAEIVKARAAETATRALSTENG